MVVAEGAITNIMGGMENSAGVRLHSHRHKLKQRFDIIRKLGQGTYGKVQLAVNKETGQEVAIKTIKKARIETEKDLIRVRREIQIMSSVQHPHIIHIYEVFENREKMVLVMEFAAGGELYDYLSERKSLAEEEARRLFRQVAGAVFYCHKHKICHRDLKLENILLDSEGNAKIADFGLSNVFDERQRLDTFCGSPLYASPEIVKGVPYIGPEVDCWSLGVLLYTLVYGAMPFDGTNFRRLVKQITQGDFYEPSTPSSASELIRRMLTVEPGERATVVDVCSHWWSNEGYPVSCLEEAEELANQTPVRLDLLLSLAPKQISTEHMLIQPEDEDATEKSDGSSLSKLPPTPDGDVIPAQSSSLGAVSLSTTGDSPSSTEGKKLRKKATGVGKPPSVPASEEEKKPTKKKEVSTEKERVKKREASSMEREKAKLKKRETSNEGLKEPVVKKRQQQPARNEKSTEKVSTVPKEEIKRPSSDRMEIEECSSRDKVRAMSGVTLDKVDEASNCETVLPIEDPAVVSPSVETTDGKSNKLSSDSSEPHPRRVSSGTKLEKGDSVKTKASSCQAEKGNSLQPCPPTTTKEPISQGPDDTTDSILKETAAKIEKVEKLIKKKEDSPTKQPERPPPTSPPVISPRTSIASSQDPSPGRSRTASESSAGETGLSKSGSKSESGSRRHSKVFSKAAMFEAAQSSVTPPDSARRTSGPRPGMLNMSDFAKKFEEKPTPEKKNRVVAPFKVADAKKAFEVKADTNNKGFRKTSIGVTSTPGSDSNATSPKSSLPTSRRGSVPSSPPGGDKPIHPECRKEKETQLPAAGGEEGIATVLPGKDPDVVKVSTSASPSRKSPQESAKSKVHSQEKTPVSKDSQKVVTTGHESSDSESEAEKMLKVVSEKREKLEEAKKAKLKDASGKNNTVRTAKERSTTPTRSPSKTAQSQKATTANFKPTKPTSLNRSTVPSYEETLSEKQIEKNKSSTIDSISEATKLSTQKSTPTVRHIPIVREGETTPLEQVPSAPAASKEKSPDSHSAKADAPVQKSQMEITLKQAKQPDRKPEASRVSQETSSNVGTAVTTAKNEAHLASPMPEPHLQRARRERIIPIMLVEDDDNADDDLSERAVTLSQSVSPSKKPQSLSKTELIKKSRRERIIPIAVEGESVMTPPISECGSTDKIRQTQNYASSQGSFSRGRGFAVDRAESFSSVGEDEEEEDEEDAFQILTAESLFSTLLSRVRALTRKMATEDGRSVPITKVSDDRPLQSSSASGSGGFWSSFYSPPRESTPTSRRITEVLSRGHSREGDSFGDLGSPLWTHGGSRGESEGDNTSTERSSNSSHFSTLPRADLFRQQPPLASLNWQHHKLIRDRFFSEFTRT